STKVNPKNTALRAAQILLRAVQLTEKHRANNNSIARGAAQAMRGAEIRK
ncbi:hypothetical protein A2U01_0093195, partial [Trifolium medium]|nr:hypothetical protein [Trifolium medium]